MHCNNSPSSKGPVGDVQLAAHVHQDKNRLVPVKTQSYVPYSPPFCKEKKKRN